MSVSVLCYLSAHQRVLVRSWSLLKMIEVETIMKSPTLKKITWIYFSVLFYFLYQKNPYVPAAIAMLC